jgi:hypothetical protein
MKEFGKDLKQMDDTDPSNPETIKTIREKAFLKAKPVIDHLELRSLDASKVAEELLYHYKRNKNIMYKALIIAMILICMDKCNKKIGTITKNILAAQADTIITTILLDSLERHKEYDPMIILTFDCLKAYLETCSVYKQGIFKEQEMIDKFFEFTNATDEVRITANKAITALVMYASVETVEKNQKALINYVFTI